MVQSLIVPDSKPPLFVEGPNNIVGPGGGGKGVLVGVAVGVEVSVGVDVGVVVGV